MYNFTNEQLKSKINKISNDVFTKSNFIIHSGYGTYVGGLLTYLNNKNNEIKKRK